MLLMKKHAPRTLFVAGVAGSVTGTVLACRATLKLEATLDDFKHDVDSVNELHTSTEVGVVHQKGGMEHRKDLAYVYLKGTGRIVKLYGPSVVISVASLVALTKSHMILSRRNAALTAAYSALSASFDSYRERVRNQIGEEKEKDLYLGVSNEKLKGEDGKTELTQVAGQDGMSPYARWFDETNMYWQPNVETNRNFLQVQQNYANHLLQTRGHIFLQEVYDMLGLERSRPAQVVGWVKNGSGDQYVDFGIYNFVRHGNVKGYEKAILLDFNVDGTVWDKI